MWGEPLVSSNAGDRVSPCVIRFCLAPFSSTAQRRAMGGAIRDAMQASMHSDPHEPMRIFARQNPDDIRLAAKAYIAPTYDEPPFVGDVTRAVLAGADRQGIPLASSARRVTVEPGSGSG